MREWKVVDNFIKSCEYSHCSPLRAWWDFQPDSEILTRGLQEDGAIIKILRDVRRKYWLNAGLYIRTQPEPQLTLEINQTWNPLRSTWYQRLVLTAQLQPLHQSLGNVVMEIQTLCSYAGNVIGCSCSVCLECWSGCVIRSGPGVLHKHPHDTWYSSTTSNFILLPLQNIC